MNKQVMADLRLADMMNGPKAMPFDGKRIICGGIKQVVEA